MVKFSRRYGFDPRISSEVLLEDAPEWLRVAYINGILSDLTYVDRDTRYSNSERRPLGIKQLYEDFCVILRQETEENYLDSWACWDHLSWLVKQCKWYGFYDLVEHIGKKLQEREEDHIFEDDWERRFGFQAYRRKVNELFAEDRIGWRLNDNSELERETPEVLSRRLEGLEKKLVDEFEPAREHYKKAIRYLKQRPLDPENSIKEIISSIESICKTIWSNSQTLGDCVKEMRKEKFLPDHIVTIIEKFYAFSCSEPAVRHGSATSSKIQINDAEFCLYLGAALIRYLISKRGRSIKD